MPSTAATTPPPPNDRVKGDEIRVLLSNLAIGEDTICAALRLNLAAEPLYGRKQVHRALHGLRDTSTTAGLKRENENETRKRDHQYNKIMRR